LADFSLFGGAEFASASEQSHVRTVITDPKLQQQHISQDRRPNDPSDFLWLMTEEPHRSRRKAILQAHPEVAIRHPLLSSLLFTFQVTKLMGFTPVTKYVVLLVVVLQLSTAYYLRNTDPFTPSFLLIAYVVGGTLNHNLFLAIHEITHNLAFPGIKMNKLLAIVANLPIGIPYAATFKVISIITSYGPY
jgi:sphingolipid 4-desaturase/C4-monooxygenase